MPKPRLSAPVRVVAPARSVTQFPIVGIGASAGGLEAFTRLLKRLPADTGMAFVLVQHLDPDHESVLAHILAQTSAMPVREATNNLRIAPDHVYVIPPGGTLSVVRGILKLRPRTRQVGLPRSIDHFFEALADDRRERAIGVVLSGTASDGTAGLEAIKAAGGITFAQDGSAKYDSMPRNAVGAGCVDFVLTPEAIARELARISRHPFVTPDAARRRSTDPATKVVGRRGAAGPSAVDDYAKILLLLRTHTGVDFSLYKTSTIHRRIMRRVVLSKLPTLGHYAEFLHGNSRELDALYSDALIGVTSFFRNAEAFELLQRKVFPRLLQSADAAPLRVWILGCSTGQEAYSVAMAFTECADKVAQPRKLQVFATDLNEANLEKARHGLYPKTLAHDLSPARLKRFFGEEDGGYRVVKPLRELVVFARQNLISDPPFSRMDLISCRNLMIYLEPSLQKKLLPTFHYALKPGGFLFLGASESIGGFSHLFGIVDKRHKVFVKKAAPTPAFSLPVQPPAGAAPALRVPQRPAQRPAGKPADATQAFRTELSAEREADRVTVNQFAPPGVLINAQLQILQFRGSTDAFLEPPMGKATFDLLKMAREGLMLPLRAAIAAALSTQKTTRQENVAYKREGASAQLHLEVVPLRNLKETCFLVLFTPVVSAPRDGATGVEPPAPVLPDDAGRISGLERELADTRDYLQSIEEEQVSSSEELQASNEEGQSANEELQSLNEELETSKEELESTNEELTTVNEEMVIRNTELNRLNSDLTNLQASTKLVVVLLGPDQTIRRFSPQAERQFSLTPADLGRAITKVRHDLQLPELEAFIAEVIDGGQEREREVQDRDGHWFWLRVRPYLNAARKVDGAVLVLFDIDVIKKSERAVAHALNFAEAIIGSVRDPFVILDADLRVQKANEAFYAAFKGTPATTLGRKLTDLDRGQWDLPPLRKLLEAVLPHGRAFQDFAVTYVSKPHGVRNLVVNARTLGPIPGRREKILVGIDDVTADLRAQSRVRQSEIRYRRLFEAAQDGILMLDPKTRRITEANPYIVKILGYTREQLLAKELWEIGLLKDEAASQEAFRELKEEGFIRYEDLPLKSKTGELREVEFVSNLYDEDGHTVIQCNIRDITERKRSEDLLRQSEERYRGLFNIIDEGFCVVELCSTAQGKANDYRFLEVNPSFEKQTGLRGALGQRMSRLVPKMEPEWFELYAAVASTGTANRFVMEAKALQRWFDVYACRIGGPGSRRLALLLSDITARKQAEEALRTTRAELAEHAGRLARRVAERTAELTASNHRLVTLANTLRKSKEEYRSLYVESEFMQKKLRHMARQILTAQEDERRHISRELHDEVVQTLVGINVQLSALGHAAGLAPQALRARITRTQRLVEKSVGAVHQFARELRPAVLDDLGLIPALHAYIKGVAAQKKLKIRLTAFAGVEGLDNARRTVLYRVAQEAVTNVVRHAHASAVKIDITAIPGAVRMLVHDNGKSFRVLQALSATTNRRLGLLGMRERVEMVGGSLVITSTPKEGTTVCAEIPFRPASGSPHL